MSLPKYPGNVLGEGDQEFYIVVKVITTVLSESIHISNDI